MSKPSIKIVRPWPAEQPRPPIVHLADRMTRTVPEPANAPRKSARSAA